MPDVGVDTAARILSEHWGIRGDLRPLPGECDRNFHVRASDGRLLVLKIASRDERRDVLELQHAVLQHLAGRELPVRVPTVLPTSDGDPIASVDAGGSRLARLLDWIPGVPMASWRPRTPPLLRHLGESLGAMARALADFRAPAARRPLKWDLTTADWIREHVPRLDGRRRALVTTVIDAWSAAVQPALAGARAGVMHNDANDHNVLVVADAGGVPRVSGIIDFGDVVETPLVADLAIALAYAMLDQPDPIGAATHVVAGYHDVHPLEASELALLLPLARTRLAVSVTNAALQRELEPDNAYLQISEDGAWRLLERLAEVHDRFAEYRLRDACGMPPCPAGDAVRTWLETHRAEFARLVDHPLDGSDVLVLDTDVASGELGGLETWHDRTGYSRHVVDRLRDSGAVVGIGRYDEVRPIYTTDLFRVEGNDGPEWRTVHTAIDVALPAGSPVHAPLAGTVHSLRDNTADGDYGPTVVLEHRVDDGRLVFWTLYGHLSRESLTQWQPGDAVPAGARLGWLGDASVNGGWWPHVHVQVIADLLDRTGDFPGVALPSERAVWLSISPDPSPLLGLDAAARAPRAPSVDALRERRQRHLGRSLSLSYRRPLHIVRGAMQHLIDVDGRRYLDAVNNVAHVGHAHPDVVRAGQRQMAVLNTNTRYLHERILEYAERLTATVPEPLRICFFVNSGSEANELALRLARAHTGERDVVVVEAGYHGNTTTLVDVSPYKFDGPGGTGAPPWVHTVPMPDTYRGPFRNDDPQAGLRYAQAVREAVGRVRQAGRRPAAFLCESLLSCGGQIVLPAGYLAEAYRHVRAAGGVCIADEVQVGMGRVGSHWWGFQTQGVVPDIVTMGKPIGNGHPLGAVITTPEIAASFANGMEFFSTFGGNPVSCAIGLAVLDVLEREGRREQAARIGTHLLEGLRGLGAAHPLVGDVRGLGLFVGVELVTDRDLRQPATRQAAYVVNRMRDLGVLVSTDGPDNNVLKIKPPLCFDRVDAEYLVSALARVLSEQPAQPSFTADAAQGG